MPASRVSVLLESQFLGIFFECGGFFLEIRVSGLTIFKTWLNRLPTIPTTCQYLKPRG